MQIISSLEFPPGILSYLFINRPTQNHGQFNNSLIDSSCVVIISSL